MWKQMVDIYCYKCLYPQPLQKCTELKIKCKQTNKQAIRERKIKVVMLQSTVENTANVFFSFIYYTSNY